MVQIPLNIEEINKTLNNQLNNTKKEVDKMEKTGKRFDVEFVDVAEEDIPFVVLDDENPTIVGELQNVHQVQGNFGPQNRYIVDTEEGKKAIYGSKAFDTLMKEIQIGDIFKAQYKGTTANRQGTRTYKTFKIYKGKQ